MLFSVEGSLQAQPTENDEAGGDGFLHGRIADNTSGTGEGHGSGAHGCTDEISDALQRRWLPASTGSRSNTSHHDAPDEDADFLQQPRETVTQNRRSSASKSPCTHRF